MGRAYNLAPGKLPGTDVCVGRLFKTKRRPNQNGGVLRGISSMLRRYTTRRATVAEILQIFLPHSILLGCISRFHHQGPGKSSYNHPMASPWPTKHHQGPGKTSYNHTMTSPWSTKQHQGPGEISYYHPMAYGFPRTNQTPPSWLYFVSLVWCEAATIWFYDEI